MKPKISTGYFTPQAKGQKNRRINRSSDGEGEGFNENLFREFMRCPRNKNAVLQLLSANKEAIKQYSEKNVERSVASPADRLKVTKKLCESPIALMRRRALEQMHGSPSSSTRSGNSKTPSEQSASGSNKSSLIPFEKVLDGVVAYAEVRGRFDEDRSAGVKSVLKSMGAEVREKFTRDVTHVVFKDASYTTFKRAKEKKTHLVSILWVESCRTTKRRQDEKNFPAMNGGYGNESMICSQMQKEYEGIIHDEYKQNVMQGATPTSKSFVNRRRTLMTLFVSHETSNPQSATINEIKGNQIPSAKRSILVEDDPVSNTSKEHLNWSDMELTHIPNQPINDQNDIPRQSQFAIKFDKRKTISGSLFTSDDSSSINLISSDKSSSRLCKKLITTGSRSVIELDESVIYGRNTAGKLKKSLETDTEMSELKLSSEFNCPKTSSTKVSSDSSKTMSNLLLSSPKDCSGQQAGQAKPAGKNSNSVSSVSSVMSSLRLESEKENCVPEQSSLESASKLSENKLISHLSSSETSNPQKSSSEKQKSKYTSDMILQENTSLVKSSTAPAETVKKNNKKQSPSDLGGARRFSLRKRNNSNRRATDFSSSDSSNDDIKNRVVKGIIADLESQDKLTSDLTAAHSSLTEDSEIIPPSHSQRPTVNTSKRSSREAGTKNTGKVAKNKSVKNVTAKKRAELSSKASSVESLNDSSDGSRKMRKLYNPDNYVMQLDESVDDEAERQEKRDLVKKTKHIGNTINPFALQLEDKVDVVITSESDESPPKIRKITKKVKDLTLNQSADEQKDLLNFVLSKNANTPKTQKPNATCIGTPTPRRSIRLINSKSAQKPVEVSMTPKNRRSTMDFVTSSERSCKKSKKKVDKTKLPTIVCTKLHKSQVQVFAEIVKKLGRFTIENDVSDKTTHLIAGESKRTVNMLRAVTRGCWVLTFDWVLRSLEEARWLSEENFEVTNFSGTVQKARLERQAFGSKYTLDVFDNCPPIYVALSTAPRCSDLQELITTCKGKVVTIPRLAKIIVGLYLVQEDTVCVNETWVLDSIMFYKKMPFIERYLLKKNRESLVV
uniref:BRCT domain-containing protein n=1 Tax=Dendroctonus ponderosae TaxID=77166 RepID=A0AAR5QKM3_DENPD